MHNSIATYFEPATPCRDLGGNSLPTLSPQGRRGSSPKCEKGGKIYTWDGVNLTSVDFYFFLFFLKKYRKRRLSCILIVSLLKFANNRSDQGGGSQNLRTEAPPTARSTKKMWPQVLAAGGLIPRALPGSGRIARKLAQSDDFDGVACLLRGARGLRSWMGEGGGHE